jgi:precorrin-2 dehydrogenase/sirohydrochlorin ferrochelatase
VSGELQYFFRGLCESGPMGYLSFNIQIKDKPVVIIGGGSVAERKVSNILPTGARITVISPTLTYTLQQLRDNGQIEHVARLYEEGDLSGAFIVITATNDHDVNLAAAREAEKMKILVEVTDCPLAGNITSPAMLRQGDLSIAISTNNKAPSLSAAIKRDLHRVYGPEYAKTVRLLGVIREKLLTDGAGSTYNKQVLSDLAENLPELFAADAVAEINRLLQKHFGAGCTLAAFESVIEDP